MRFCRGVVFTRIVLFCCLAGSCLADDLSAKAQSLVEDSDTPMGEVPIMLANVAIGTPPPPDMMIKPFKSMADRVREENAKKQKPAA